MKKNYHIQLNEGWWEKRKVKVKTTTKVKNLHKGNNKVIKNTD